MNERELRLAIALAAILFLGGGWLAFKKLTAWKTRIEAAELSMAQRKVEAEGLLQQKDFWTLRSDWLNKNQPVYKNRNEADNQLLTYVKGSAKDNDVDLTLSQLDQPELQPGMMAATMTVDAKAEYGKMWKWIHSLQSNPADFISVRSIEIKPNLEDTKILEVTDLRIQKWFRTQEGAQ